MPGGVVYTEFRELCQVISVGLKGSARGTEDRRSRPASWAVGDLFAWYMLSLSFSQAGTMRLLPSNPDIVSRIDSGDIDLQPEFQRGEVWGKFKKQRLIVQHPA